MTWIDTEGMFSLCRLKSSTCGSLEQILSCLLTLDPPKKIIKPCYCWSRGMQRRWCRELEYKFTSKMDSFSILSCFGKVFLAPVKGRHLGEKVRNKFYLALSIDLNTNGTVLDCSNERKSLNKYLSRICHRSLLLLSRPCHVAFLLQQDVIALT